MSELLQYLTLYKEQQSSLNAAAPGFMNAVREEAFRRLTAEGLPTQGNERYKYCSVADCLAPDYGLNLRRAVAGSDPYRKYPCTVPGLRTTLCCVENDVPFAVSPASQPLPDGVVVLPFSVAASQYGDVLQRTYHQAASRSYDAITQLNALLAQDGILIYIKERARAKSPIQIVNVSSANADLMQNRRYLVVAEAGAEVSLLFCDRTEADSRYLSTEVVEVYLDEGARVEVFDIEESREGSTHFRNLYVEQHAGSRFSLNDLTLHSGSTRNQTDVRLLGEGAYAELNGAVITDGGQRVEHNILVTHQAPRCESDMLYKCVVGGSSTSAFAGKVLVVPGAQQTVSQQTNANLCTSAEARAFSQPMLEIYADDVKCNHGSTVGKLDETALFYMRQRGIDEAEARLLLQHAFVNEVISRVGIEPLRERISYLVEQRFRGHLGSKCHGCDFCGRPDVKP